MAKYTLVLKGTSTVKFRIDDPLILHQYGAPDVSIIARTRYEDLGLESPIPRELWVEVQLEGDSLEQAEQRGANMALSVPSWIAFAANASVDVPRLELAFDVSPDKVEHEFLQVFCPDEKGPLRSLRYIESGTVGWLISVASNLPSKLFGRAFRAINQYQQSLLNWIPGQEILATGHLYMAADTLTKAFLQRRLDAVGSRDGVMRELGVNDVTKLDSTVRLRDVFQDKVELYKAVSEVSNVLEHGYRDFSEIRGDAVRYRNEAARCVRNAIIELLSLPEELIESLKREKYTEVKGPPEITKRFRGTLHGPADKLADDNHSYPYVEWSSKLDSLVWNGIDGYEVKISEQLTKRFGEGILWSPSTVSVYRN